MAEITVVATPVAGKKLRREALREDYSGPAPGQLPHRIKHPKVEQYDHEDYDPDYTVRRLPAKLFFLLKKYSPFLKQPLGVETVVKEEAGTVSTKRKSLGDGGEDDDDGGGDMGGGGDDNLGGDDDDDDFAAQSSSSAAGKIVLLLGDFISWHTRTVRNYAAQASR